MISNSLIISFQDTDFARSIANVFSMSLQYAKKITFADGELQVTLEDSASYLSRTVYIVHTISNPTNDSIMSLAFLAHALKNAGAARVIAIIPYLGYARQVESAIPGKPGHLAVIAQLLEGAGIDEIVTIEMHTESARELFSIPVHSIGVHDVLRASIKQKIGTRTDVCLVAPDEGARQRVSLLAAELGLSYIVFRKERYAADKTRLVGYEGQNAGSCAIIIDDILATGGTAVQVCDALHAMQFKTIYGYFVHPLFVGKALEKIQASHFNGIVIGNTIAISPAVRDCPLVSALDLSNFIVNELHKMSGWSIKQATPLHNESAL